MSTSRSTSVQLGDKRINTSRPCLTVAAFAIGLFEMAKARQFRSEMIILRARGARHGAKVKHCRSADRAEPPGAAFCAAGPVRGGVYYLRHHDLTWGFGYRG